MAAVLPSLLIALIIGSINGRSYGPEDESYDQLIPYLYSLWDFQDDAEDNSMLSREDSMILASFNNYFLADKEMLQEDVFKRLGMHPKDKFSLKNIPNSFPTLTYRLNRAFAELAYTLKVNIHFLLFYCTAFFCLALLAMHSKSALTDIIKIFIVCHVFLFIIAFYIKMEYRIANPLITIATLIACLRLPQIDLRETLVFHVCHRIAAYRLTDPHQTYLA